MAFKEVTLNFQDLVTRALAHIGFVYKPHCNKGEPDIFDQEGKPISVFKNARFHPDGTVCLWLVGSDGECHMHSEVELSDDEECLLGGCPFDEELLH